MLSTQDATITTRTDSRRNKFIIEDAAAWAETWETAQKVRSDSDARQSYLMRVASNKRGDYVPLYFLLQKSDALELREEISQIVATERHADLSPVDALNRNELCKRIRAAICNAMLKATAEVLCRPAFFPQSIPLNVSPMFSSVYYYTDYVLYTEVAEAVVAVTTLGVAAEAVFPGVPTQTAPASSDVLRTVTSPGECRAIAEFIAPLLWGHEVHSAHEAGDVELSSERLPVLTGSNTLGSVEPPRMQ